MAELFDAYKTTYGATVDDSINFSGLKHSFFLQAKVDVMQQLLPARGLTSDVEALDVGCGIGTFHPLVRPLLPNLSGCDISSESIDRAKQDNPWVKYSSYGGVTLPYRDATFDYAFAICVAHHVPPADWPAFFSEMRRVVRPGGLVSIIEHNPWNPLTRLAVLRCPFDEDAVLLRREKTATHLREAGLHDIDHTFFLLFPWENRTARKVESWFSRLPIGAQYACSGRV